MHLFTILSVTILGASAVPIESEDRLSSTNSGLVKRDSVTWDAYKSVGYSQFHQSLTADLGPCYALKNGWNKDIQSLSVPQGYGCAFYKERGCPPQGKHFVTTDFNNDIDAIQDIIGRGTYDSWTHNDQRFGPGIGSYWCWFGPTPPE